MGVKTGDRVRFLNSVGGGVVDRIVDGIAYVEDEDGFVTPVLVREVVVVGNETSTKDKISAKSPENEDVKPEPKPVPVIEEDDFLDEPFEETPEGEKITLQLAFMPMELKKLDTTTWETYLVNDSNYWLSVVLMAKGNEQESWNLISATNVEPGTQVFLAEITTDDLPELDKVKLQYLAFKREKSFESKPPVEIVEKIDTTKFFKLHCYSPTVYFEEPVIKFDLVKADEPLRARRGNDSGKLEKELTAKRAADLRPTTRRIKKRTPVVDPMAPLVVDLHIAELVDKVRGMTSADILNRQVDEFRAAMDANMRYKGKKIVFIHGKGEGVLRNALLKEMNHRYKNCEVRDASFKEYGFGATEVIIR